MSGAGDKAALPLIETASFRLRLAQAASNRHLTEALGELDTPGAEELADASEGFLEEFEVSREGGAYRGGSEAA